MQKNVSTGHNLHRFNNCEFPLMTRTFETDSELRDGSDSLEVEIYDGTDHVWGIKATLIPIPITHTHSCQEPWSRKCEDQSLETEASTPHSWCKPSGRFLDRWSGASFLFPSHEEPGRSFLRSYYSEEELVWITSLVSKCRRLWVRLESSPVWRCYSRAAPRFGGFCQ